MSYQWVDTMSLGAWGEQVILEWLKRTGCSVRDVRLDPAQQRRDIDFLVQVPLGRDWIGVEVKSDSHRSENFYLEEYSNRSVKSPGCIFRTCADFLVYYFVKSGRVFIIPAQDLKSWFRLNLDKYRPINFVSSGRTGVSFPSQGRRVPIYHLKKVLSLQEYRNFPRLEKT